MLKNTMVDNKRHRSRSSAELEKAVQQHREHANKLLTDSRNRRAGTLDTMSAAQPEHSVEK